MDLYQRIQWWKGFLKMQSFVSEYDSYQILQHHGFSLAKYQYLQDDEKPTLFGKDDQVVFKGVVQEVWHKSEEGLVFIGTWSEQKYDDFVCRAKEKFKERYQGCLVVEKVSYAKIPGLPTECFLSFKEEKSYGPVARFGLGGVHTEAWARKHGPMIILPGDDPTDTFNKFEDHFLGEIFLGKLRTLDPLVTREQMIDFFKHIQTILGQWTALSLDLLEINPLVLTKDQKWIPLDGVGLKNQEINVEIYEKKTLSSSFHQIKSAAIAGVSSKKISFGNIILNNLKNSKIPQNQLYVIKDECDYFDGIKCVSDVASLQQRPVDHLILSLPPLQCVQMIMDLCEQGQGADFVSLVAGGLGDGADKEKLGARLLDFLQNRKKQQLWVPRILGPNCLGMINSDLELSTLFIPEFKLPVKYHQQGKILFVSQSGAFFITRLSQYADLPIKYAYCTGNQMDIGPVELTRHFLKDEQIKVMTFYLEGFKERELFHWSVEIKNAVNQGKKIIVYKAGRSSKGQLASAGHTGAMGGAYSFEQHVLHSSGALVVESFQELVDMTRFYTLYSDLESVNSVGVISNAGFETVSAADCLDELLCELPKALEQSLAGVIKEQNLSHLVHASNPLDLTPMADEQSYLKSAMILAKGYDALILSIVPLTERLETFQNDKMEEFARLVKSSISIPLIVVIDSGPLYDNYRKSFEAQGLIVMNSLERAGQVFKTAHRCF